jgi:hypothetical protein
VAHLALIRPALLLFLLLFGVSALTYVGGNVVDFDHPGYHPLYTFLCDSFYVTSYYSGESNLASAAFAIAAVAVLTLGAMLPAWYHAPARLHLHPWARQVLPRLGVLAALCLLVIPLEQVLALPLPHFAAILVGSVPAWLATLLLMFATFGDRRCDGVMRATALLVLSGTGALVLGYLWVVQAGLALTPVAFAVTQKLLLLAVLYWLYRISRLFERPADPEDPADERRHPAH